MADETVVAWIESKNENLAEDLNERARRRWAAVEALSLGRGGMAAVADAPGHSWQNVACIGSSIGEKGILFAARVLAVTALDLFQDPQLVQTARRDFQQRVQGKKYVSLIPTGQTAPATIRG